MSRILIEKGADVNAVAFDNYTPLIIAVIKENIEIARLLIESGANIDTGTSKEYDTPLIIAVKKENIEIARLLIEAGANVNLVNQNGNDPLSIAVTKENIEIARLLIESGANIDTGTSKEYDTPLIIAVKKRKY